MSVKAGQCPGGRIRSCDDRTCRTSCAELLPDQMREWKIWDGADGLRTYRGLGGRYPDSDPTPTADGARPPLAVTVAGTILRSGRGGVSAPRHRRTKAKSWQSPIKSVSARRLNCSAKALVRSSSASSSTRTEIEHDDVARSYFRSESRLSIDGPINQWDAAALLSVMIYSWNDIFRNPLGRFERSMASELLDWRNEWAHPRGRGFSSEDTERVSRLRSAPPHSGLGAAGQRGREDAPGVAPSGV